MADKIVEFEVWCHKCKYAMQDEQEPPCDTCLEEPVNDDSYRPVCFKMRGED